MEYFSALKSPLKLSNLCKLLGQGYFFFFFEEMKSHYGTTVVLELTL